MGVIIFRQLSDSSNNPMNLDNLFNNVKKNRGNLKPPKKEPFPLHVTWFYSSRVEKIPTRTEAPDVLLNGSKILYSRLSYCVLLEYESETAEA